MNVIRLKILVIVTVSSDTVHLRLLHLQNTRNATEWAS